MKKKRLIFNIDGTLLNKDPSITKRYFEEKYGTCIDPFVSDLSDNLNYYEKIFDKYTCEDLASFLTSRGEFVVTPEVIEEWNYAMAHAKDNMASDVIETLDYLKRDDFSLAILTNWFGDCQISRLKNAGIFEFFDDIYTGDYVLKPHRDAYIASIGEYSNDECMFIGNSIERDYIAPRALGIEGILYDPHDINHETIIKVKKLGELKGNRRIYGK